MRAQRISLFRKHTPCMICKKLAAWGWDPHWESHTALLAELQSHLASSAKTSLQTKGVSAGCPAPTPMANTPHGTTPLPGAASPLGIRQARAAARARLGQLFIAGRSADEHQCAIQFASIRGIAGTPNSIADRQAPRLWQHAEQQSDLLNLWSPGCPTSPWPTMIPISSTPLATPPRITPGIKPGQLQKAPLEIPP